MERPFVLAAAFPFSLAAGAQSVLEEDRRSRQTFDV